jgi:hypothetical protein
LTHSRFSKRARACRVAPAACAGTTTLVTVSRDVIRADESQEVPFAKGHAKTPIENFPVGPDVLYWAPKHVQSLWKAKEIFITEICGSRVI